MAQHEFSVLNKVFMLPSKLGNKFITCFLVYGMKYRFFIN